MRIKQKIFTLPERIGDRPKTAAQPPHLQQTQQSPPAIYDELAEWAFFTLPPKLPVREQQTLISVPTTRALWLDGSVRAAHKDSFMPPSGSREFWHLHADGSTHLCVSDDVAREVCEKNWGEPHPWKDRGVNEILVYAPRDESEITVAKRMMLQSFEYASGRAVDPDL